MEEKKVIKEDLHVGRDLGAVIDGELYQDDVYHCVPPGHRFFSKIAGQIQGLSTSVTRASRDSRIEHERDQCRWRYKGCDRTTSAGQIQGLSTSVTSATRDSRIEHERDQCWSDTRIEHERDQCYSRFKD
ncbi:hypothetical protein RRG08_007698 [Elysia crispata]|uniref:Uncharacterized protein n=1 Tax=Elysia crispata TaxID=231223 RepID=A0AAE0YTT7_9GAST|nr:hypothetical protein RRG08_007698 [Elysia crispata]